MLIFPSHFRLWPSIIVIKVKGNMFQLFPWDGIAGVWFRSRNHDATGNEHNFNACLILSYVDCSPITLIIFKFFTQPVISQ